MRQHHGMVSAGRSPPRQPSNVHGDEHTSDVCTQCMGAVQHVAGEPAAGHNYRESTPHCLREATVWIMMCSVHSHLQVPLQVGCTQHGGVMRQL